MPGAGTALGLQKHIPKRQVGQESLEPSHSPCDIAAARPAPPSSQAAHACQMLHVWGGGEEWFRGQGHKRCLTLFFVKGPCRGRGNWEEIPACVCKNHPGCDSRSSLHMFGSGEAGSCTAWGSLAEMKEAEQHNTLGHWDAPSCIALTPLRELQLHHLGSTSSCQRFPSPPSLLCGKKMLHWE